MADEKVAARILTSGMNAGPVARPGQVPDEE